MARRPRKTPPSGKGAAGSGAADPAAQNDVDPGLAEVETLSHRVAQLEAVEQLLRTARLDRQALEQSLRTAQFER